MLLAKESIRIFEGLVEELKHTSKKAIKVEELFRIANQENVEVLLPKGYFQ